MKLEWTWAAFGDNLVNSFLPAFWPDLVATVIGVVVGLPFAVWLTRHSVRVQDEARRREDRARLVAALQTVVAALKFNTTRLNLFQSQLSNKRAPFDVALDTSAWEAVRDEVIPFLRVPDLQRRSAYYFARLVSVGTLSRIYLDQVAGIGSALGGIEGTSENLRGFLIATCQELITTGEQLASELESEARKNAAG